MPLPTDLVPVSKPATPKITPQKGLPKDLVPVKTGIDNPMMNVVGNQIIAQRDQPLGDPQMAKAEIELGGSDSNIHEHQLEWLKQNRPNLTPQQFDHSLDVFAGKKANWWTENQYYFDRNGLPQQIAFGERAPDYALIQSKWGSQAQAEDDTWLTTLSKKAYNSFVDIVKLPATLIDLGYNLFGGENSTPLSDYLRNVADVSKFNTSTESNKEIAGKPDGSAFTSMSDVFNSENWNFSGQNIAGLLGSGLGMIGQMYVLGGGGVSKALAGEEVIGNEVVKKGLSMSQKLAPYAKATGANTLFMLNSSYDAAAAHGLKGRERMAVALTSAIGQGVIMSLMFPAKPYNPLTKDAQKIISDAAVKDFVKTSGGKITPESLRAAYATTLETSASVLKSKPFLLAKHSAMTGNAMVVSHAFDNAVFALSDKMNGKDAQGVFSPESFRQYFNSWFSGAAMGLVGGMIHGVNAPEPTEKELQKQQSQMVYAYVKEGKEAEFIHNIDGLLANEQITPEQAAAAKTRVAAYKRFNQETADVKLTDEAREEVFNATWKAEGLKKEIADLEANQNMTEAIKQAKLKDLQSRQKAQVDEIARILGKANKEAAEKPVEEPVKPVEPIVPEVKPIPSEPVVNEPSPDAPETKTQLRRRIVKTVIDENPEFIHHKPREVSPGVFSKTETVQGAYTIAKDRGEGPVENQRWEARKKIKVGDVLTVRRFLPKGGKPFKITGREGIEREHLLNVFDEAGQQVGSIKYNSDNDLRIQQLMDEGHDVRIVVTNKNSTSKNNSKDNLEYQIISRPREGQTKEAVRARHETENSVEEMSARQLHDIIVATNRAKPREKLKRAKNKIDLEDAINKENTEKTAKTIREVNETLSEREKEIESKMSKDFTDNYEQRKAEYLSKHGHIFDTDRAREFSPEYKANPELLSSATQIPAREFVNRMYQEELRNPASDGKENAVAFMAGGSGVGKSEFANTSIKNNQITVDTNLSNFERSVKDIDEALASGKGVEIKFVYRDPVKAYLNGVVSRIKDITNRRGVPVDIAIAIHKKALATIIRLAEQYKDNKNVKFEYIDNSFLKGEAKQVTLDYVKQLKPDFDQAKKEIKDELDRQLKSGELSEIQYAGLTGTGIQAERKFRDRGGVEQVARGNEQGKYSEIQRGDEKTGRKQVKPVVEKSTVTPEEIASGTVHNSSDGKYRVVKADGALKVYDVTGKEPSKTTSGKIIKEYLRTFDFEKGESAFEGMPEGTIPESDIDRFVAENSNKPSELIDTFTKIQSEEPIVFGDYVDEIIAANIGKVKGKSYNEFGDKNNVTMGKAKAYFGVEGDSIDTLAQYLSEVAGTEIRPQDIVDFIDRFPNGTEQYFREQKNPLLQQLSDRFVEIAGFKLSPRSIEAYRDQQLKAYKIEKEYFEKEFETYEEAVSEYEKDIAEGRITPEEIRPDVPEKDSDGASAEESKIKNQTADGIEPLADPELQKQILDQLSKVFPKIEAFSDAEKFQQFLDRNFPGERLDTSKLGAAIGEAVYINPNRAVQSTAIHEYAHIYWDSLPENDALKAKIKKLFPDEEAAITAIGQLGTKAAKIKLSSSAKLKFVQHVKEFWAKIKNLFGAASKEDLAELFASKVWQGSEAPADGPLKYMAAKLTDAQQRAVKQLQQIANHFEYDPLAHTYTLVETDVQYKPVNDILQADKRYSYKGKTNIDSGKTGNDLHTLAESIAKGEDFEAAFTRTKLKMTPEAKEQFRSQVSKVIEKLRAKGELLPETIFANSYYKTAGRPDLPIVDANGVLHIYDFKTSTATTTGEGSFYTKETSNTASKKDKHGAQLALYAKIAEHGDPLLGVSPQKIGESGIIPIRITMGENGEITRVEVEPVINVAYDNYRGEATRLLQKQRVDQREADAREIKFSGAKSRKEYLKSHKIDIEAIEAELDALGDTEADAARQQEIYDTLENIESQYEKYKEDYQKVKSLQKADLSQFSYEELVDAMNTIKTYDNLLHNIAMKEIQVEAGKRMTKMRTDELAEKGVEAGNEKDLRDRDPYFKALSDIPEDLPAMQMQVKKYAEAKQAEETEHLNVDQQARKLFANVIKDNGGAGVNLKGDMSKFYENLFAKKADEDGPAVLKDWRDLSNGLKQSERAVLKFMDEKMSEFQQKQALSERGVYDGFYAEISPNFWESYHKNGFLSALGEKFRQDQPDELGDMEVTVTIDGKKSVVKYDQAEKMIKEAGNRNLLTKAAAALKLARAHMEAKKELDKYIAKNAGTDSAIKVKGAASRFTLNDNGEMVGKFHWKRKEGKDVSYDVYRSFMSYMTDAIHVKHMQPLLPELDALRTYYQDRGTNPNALKFMEHWIDGDIFGKEFVGMFGRDIDTGIKFLQGWTYFNVMPFNMSLGKFNWLTGKTNQLRSEGFKKLLVGEARYFKNFKKNQGILKHYTVVEPMTDGPAKYSARNIWDATSNVFVSGGENSIRGAAFFSNMSDAEYKQVMANFDKQGNIIDRSKDLSPSRITQLKKMTEDVQGKYAFADKRMYKHYVGLRAAMMFKGWMPDFIKERFGKEYTDIYGVTHKGSYRSIPMSMRDLKLMFTDITGDSVNAVNNRKNIREALMFSTLLGIYATTFGDSAEEKKKGAWLLKMATDLAGPLNPTNTKRTIAKPFPIMGTVSNFIDVLGSLTSFYARDSKFGKKGDWMFPGKALSVLPYNKMISAAVAEAVNPDYKGN